MVTAVSTGTFETARAALERLDRNVFDPLCRIEFLAIPPRIVQIAVNVLGLVEGAVRGAVMNAACVLPFPESFTDHAVVWRDDAWTFTQQMIDSKLV
jgi:hypothetical protein